MKFSSAVGCVAGPAVVGALAGSFIAWFFDGGPPMAKVAATFAAVYGSAALFILLTLRIEGELSRSFLQSAIIGSAFAPSILGGHGFAVAPAWYVLLLPHHASFALGCMAVTSLFAFPLCYFAARVMNPTSRL